MIISSKPCSSSECYSVLSPAQETELVPGRVVMLSGTSMRMEEGEFGAPTV